MSLLALFAGIASAFTLHTTEDGGSVQWPTFPLRYRLDTANTEGFDDPEGIVAGAFEAWEMEGTEVRFEEDPDSENRVWFSEDWPFDEELLALTSVQADGLGRLVRFEIRVNGTQIWATDGSPEAYDLQAAITHEVGHALGIEHSEFEEATMYASIGQGDTSRREIHDDDREALLFLYTPDEPAVPPPAASGPSLPLSCSTAGSWSSLGWLAGLLLFRIRHRV